MTIVVGYIPTPEGDAALDRAIAEAQLRHQGLVIVNTTTGGAYADPRWATDDQLNTLKTRLHTAGVDFELVHTVITTQPADHLVDVTDKAHAELLIIGLRHRTAVGKFLLGSSASHILMHAPCPVLAVKAPGSKHWPHH